MQTARRFLQLYALLHVAGGLLLPWLVQTALFDPYFATASAALHLPDTTSLRFLSGLIGPTIASWGLLFFLLVQQAFAHPSRRLWWGMVLAALLWAPYDSLLSWQQGISANVLLNLISLAALLIPLLCVRRHFTEAPPP